MIDMAYTIKKHVFEVIEAAEKASKREEKIQILRQNESWALKDMLRATYDDSIKFMLPPGEPPYTPNEEGSIPSTFLKQNTQLKYVVKGPIAEKMLPVKPALAGRLFPEPEFPCLSSQSQDLYPSLHQSSEAGHSGCGFLHTIRVVAHSPVRLRARRHPVFPDSATAKRLRPPGMHRAHEPRPRCIPD